MNRNNRPKKTKSFKEIIESIPSIKDCYRDGAQALGKYSSKVEVPDNGLLCGSVDLDGCLNAQKMYTQDNRWDYILCYNGIVYFLEVHSADTSEVSVVLKKLAWLKRWINEHGSELKGRVSTDRPYTWVQSGGYHIKQSPQARRLASAGLRPVRELKL